MPHWGLAELHRLLAGDSAWREAEAAAEHLVSCDHCRSQAGTVIDGLRAANPDLRGEGPLKLVFDLIDRERQWGLESLAAVAEWSEVRRLPSRRSQRDRVRMSKACRTLSFFRLVLGEVKETSSWDEAEFLAGLALLAVQAMSHRQLSEVSQCDRQAEVWIAVANARRRAAEWKRAHQALANAERFLTQGTRDPMLEASLLSIAASTLADEGRAQQALEALERCQAIYDKLSEWALLARALVQRANILEQLDPVRALAALDHAVPMIPAADSALRLAAEMLRVECLIGTCKPGEALRVFHGTSHLLTVGSTARTRIRSRFTCARLLDAFGYRQQAERLFYEVVERDIENDLYKDAFLDLLYLYEHHRKAGDLEKAARVCRRALTDATLAEVAHDQLRTVWTQLLEATQRQAVGLEILAELRRYLGAHWKHPAAAPPVVAFR